MIRLSNRLAAALALATFAPALSAQTLLWDVGHTVNPPTGGAGSWTAATTGTGNWSNGTADVFWPNNATTAVFGSPAGTVTIDAAGVTAGGLTFNITAYTIAAASGGSLTLTNAATINAAVATSTISAQIRGSGTLVKTGVGDLILNNSTNSFSHAVTVTDGGRINASGAPSGTPFGTGPITLIGSVLRGSATTGATVAHALASGTGGALTYAGSSSLVMNRNAGTLTWTIGDPAATTSSLVRSGRGTLAINTTLAVGFAATGAERVFVNGGVPTVSPGGTNSNSYVPAYIFGILSSGAGTAPDFLTYNASNGFQALPALYTSTDITTSAATDVVNQTTAPTLTANAQAFGLRTTQNINLNGNTLTLGNGTDAAGLYLVATAGTGAPIAGITGPGTIDFRGSEGVIVVPVTNPFTGALTIAGTNGVTFTSTANATSSPRPAFNGATTVTTDMVTQNLGITIAENTATTSGAVTGTLKVGTPGAPKAFTFNSPGVIGVTNGFLYVGFRNVSQTGDTESGTLDLADASAVSITVSTLHVGRSISQTGTGASTGAFLLPTSAAAPVSITATSTFAVGGDNQASPATYGLATPQVTLAAGTNVVTTPTLKVGGFNTGATVTIRPGGALTLAGPNGTATNVNIGDNSISTQTASNTATSSVDLTGGRITANIGTLTLGAGNATAAGTVAASGTLIVDGATSAVTIAAATLGNVRGTGAADGTLTVLNGNVTINSLTMTSQNGTGAASATLRLANSATVTLNGPINVTTGAGAGPRTTTIDLLGGTLNMNNNAVGDVTTFNFAGGTLTNPGTITRSTVSFDQTGGTLVRNAAGTTTIVGGAYNLTAPAVANVTAGSLLANGVTGSSAGTGTVNVFGSGTVGAGGFVPGNGGTLGGSGTINGNVVVSKTTGGSQGGTLSPGNSIGTLTIGSGTMTWNPGGSYLFEHNVQSASPATPGVDNDFVSSAGALNLANLTANSFNLNLVPTNLPATQTTFAPVQYTLGTFAGGVTGPGGSDLSGATISNLFNFSGAFLGSPSVMVSPTGGNVLLTFQPVPEPVGVLAACGAAGLIGWVRRRRKTT